ncbi:hypothetical protein CKO42_09065 [Lamprobacter modestohalophilus]|uniref:Uncharacterized protein n=1 Tax=Lamprobacter modestohalophilus TaxID=1064514 RepID=A0A9X1B3N1_9GAMM|nr:hypothetical protein [Lamprobacter modestohalophilus]
MSINELQETKHASPLIERHQVVDGLDTEIARDRLGAKTEFKTCNPINGCKVLPLIHDLIVNPKEVVNLVPKIMRGRGVSVFVLTRKHSPLMVWFQWYETGQVQADEIMSC